MGKNNSSNTRVVPVFESLYSRDPSGENWLLRLLSLGSRAREVDLNDIGNLKTGHERWWGKNEKRLAAPPSLLEWLVRNVKAPSNASLWGRERTRAKREKLAARDAETRDKALELLKGSTRGWHVLEGPSSPDAFIETEKAVIVIEGKRTEGKATTTTTWMPLRSQMIRHMDAAWEVRGGRRVLGLMIVEGQGSAEAVDVNEHWQGQTTNQLTDEMLETSLPHRTAHERRQIAAGFLGSTTWQRVCREFSLPWPPA